MKKTIIFDFGGVLIDWDPRHLYKKIFEDESEMEWFLGNVCTLHWNLQQDGGRPFADAVAMLQEQHPQYAGHIQAYHTRWEEMLNGPIEDTVQILHELKRKGYTIYGLTNWSAETFPVALQRFDFLHELDGIVVSGEEKIVKPDNAIFNLLLKRYNLKAPDCIFIDDNLYNIEAAHNLGFGTIHFASPANLKSRLQEMSVL
ncbi:MAG TPA: HAD family phosphatase [Chitinophagaceae bacterium]|nr:HAD family phosphatase [Chitinophagaceae bacterium]